MLKYPEKSNLKEILDPRDKAPWACMWEIILIGLIEVET